MQTFEKKMFVFLLIVAVSSWASSEEIGMLFPQNSETREMTNLDGLWRFYVGEEVEERLMPVPASYNDVVTESSLRDHVGVVRYERTFFVPKSWQGQDVWIRFGSVNYRAQVFVNGVEVVEHQIGHLPFKAKITKVVKYGVENDLRVLVDNRLYATTIPQGNVSKIWTDDGEKPSQTYTFDFFNYAGIHRPVYLYKTPVRAIDDVSIITHIVSPDLARIDYNINVRNDDGAESFRGVKLYDANGTFVTSVKGSETSIKVPNPNLWWPYLMNPEGTTPGYLYTLQIEVHDEAGDLVDLYRMKVGIRTLKWNNSTFELNGKQVYMTGFGRHEDSDLRGRGLDYTTVMKDHNLIKWVGANAYRTSHYPYAEEILQLADTLGIMIIDECPAVNIENVTNALMENHKTSIKELIQRDKNHPSVVAWSIANEPRSQRNNSEPYWQKVAAFAKEQDTSRPITASINRQYFEDHLAQFLDIISFNRYNSWYENEGHLDMIVQLLLKEARNWREKFNKPVLMSEYGADTMEGLHLSPAYIWSEEYQVEVMTKHFKAFDQLRNEGWFIGEFIWNFADFKTSQKTTRVGGNKKGIFTRNRQPKAAAHLLRKRYFHIARKLYNAPLPLDLEEYIIDDNQIHLSDEL